MTPQERLSAIGIVAGDVCGREQRVAELDKWLIIRLLALGSEREIKDGHHMICNVLGRPEWKGLVP